MNKFEYLEHTADIKFAAYGKTREEVFNNCAKALINSICDIEKLKITKKIKIIIKSKNIQPLLYDFLSEILYQVDANSFLTKDCVNISITKKDNNNNNNKKNNDDDENDNNDNNNFVLKATLCGDHYKNKNYEIKTDIKSVTYNSMSFEKTKTGFKAVVVIDQ